MSAPQSETCRLLAKVEREAAAATSLPQRRALHLRSAEAWEAMAQKLNTVAAHAVVNAAAKAERDGEYNYRQQPSPSHF